MNFNNIDRKHEQDEAEQEARELAITIKATERMHNATESEIDDIMAILPEQLAVNMVRSYIAQNVEMRMFVHEYFCRAVEKAI